MVYVEVGVKVEVAVAVFVGVKVGVNVRVGVFVMVGVKVAVGVRVRVAVNVGISVAVGVGVDGGPIYPTSTARKSTYPPDAERDQDLHPAGTDTGMLTNPGRLPPVLYKYHVVTEPHAHSVAVPTPPSRVKATIASK